MPASSLKQSALSIALDLRITHSVVGNSKCLSRKIDMGRRLKRCQAIGITATLTSCFLSQFYNDVNVDI
jgi:hypothetical protein